MKITTERARKLAGEWHGGQWSELYKFASSGECYYLPALNEVLNIIYEPEVHPRPYERPKYLQNELLKLKRYFESKIDRFEYYKNFYGFEYARYVSDGKMKVTIPKIAEHEGLPTNLITLEIIDRCPWCGMPRGKPYKAFSYDGSRKIECDAWINSCGHIDLYKKVVVEGKPV